MLKYVNVMAPLPSISLTTCLRKSVLHMPSLRVHIASSSSSTCQILPIAFISQAGISPFFSSPYSQTFGKPRKQLPLRIIDPSVHLNRPVVLVAEKFLHILVQAFTKRLDLHASSFSTAAFFSSTRSGRANGSIVCRPAFDTEISGVPLALLASHHSFQRTRQPPGRFSSQRRQVLRHKEVTKILLWAPLLPRPHRSWLHPGDIAHVTLHRVAHQIICRGDTGAELCR